MSLPTDSRTIYYTDSSEDESTAALNVSRSTWESNEDDESDGSDESDESRRLSDGGSPRSSPPANRAPRIRDRQLNVSKGTLIYCGIRCLPIGLLVIGVAVAAVLITRQHKDQHAIDRRAENVQFSAREAENLQFSERILPAYCLQVPAGQCRESCCPSGLTCFKQPPVPSVAPVTPVRSDSPTAAGVSSSVAAEVAQNAAEAAQHAAQVAADIEKRWHKLLDRIVPGVPPQQFCTAKLHTVLNVCLAPPDPRCVKLVNNITTETRAWTLVITSGGGGGHLSAAKNVGEIIKKAWENRLDAVAADLQASRHLMYPSGLAAINQTLRAVRAKGAPIEMIDIMDSPCTNLLGAAGVHLGDQMEESWNQAQAMGDVKRLKIMANPDINKMANKVFGRQCHDFMHSVLVNNRLPREGRPSQVFSTEPLFLWPIVKAVTDVMSVPVNLYMTDMPGPVNTPQAAAGNFFIPIRSMVDKHPHAAKYFYLHSIASPDGTVDDIVEQTHLDRSRIIVEPYMPVAPAFLDGSLPRPHTATEITIHAQLPEEQRFLGGEEKSFSIAAEDTLTLVMMGSQPTASAINLYFQGILKLARKGDHIDWFFIACGPHEKPAFAKIYIDLAIKAAALERYQIANGKTLRVVPFTGQPAQMMEGRADTTVTRSGGMTAGELLACAMRGDRKRVLIHVEQLGDTTTEPPRTASELTKWQNKLLQKAMVPWEASNARYLIAKVGAQLTTPRTFASIMSS